MLCDLWVENVNALWCFMLVFEDESRNLAFPQGIFELHRVQGVVYYMIVLNDYD